jgi:peptidoglycan/LPS O-acetylase OafA/YrhL
VDQLKHNNFDLIRLLAASQVMLMHGAKHLDVPLDHTVRYLIHSFPGVPVFFFISGFLISASWERITDVRVYVVNRFLRLYPAFFAAFLLSLVAILISFPPARDPSNLIDLSGWAFATVLLLPWTPGFLEGYGMGSVNAALWTIPIEVSFYILIPILYTLLRRHLNLWLLVIALASFSVLYLLFEAKPQAGNGALLIKVLNASFVPWFGMFCCGVLAQRHADRVLPWVAGKALPIGIAYFTLALVSREVPLYPLLKGAGNTLGLINFFVLSAFVLSLAYTKRSLSDQVLKRNDLSYGIYILHMPVVNLLIVYGAHGWPALALLVAVTLTLACMSWWLVEKPALKLKSRALYRH